MNSIIHYRGGTAQFFDKKSFALKTCDEKGEECDTTLMGFRPDHNWVLDAMAVDMSRMRNRLCFDLWNEVASLRDSDMIANGSHGQYVELLVNGRYQGIYCLSDKVNRKLLGLKKYHADEEPHYRGFLYKCTDNQTVTSNMQLPDNYQTTKDPSWYDWSLEYPDDYPSEEAWEPLIELLSYTTHCDASHPAPIREELKEHFHMSNYFEYSLFLMALSCIDNSMHNAFYSYKNIDKNRKAWITPWDLDGSLGRDGASNSFFQWTALDVCPLADALPFRAQYDRRDSLFMTELAIRWNEWRRGEYSVERFNQRIDSMAAALTQSGAWCREVTRWDCVNVMPAVGSIDLDEDLTEETGRIKEWYQRNHKALNQLLLPYLPDSHDRLPGERILAEDYGVSSWSDAETNGICLNKALASDGHVILQTPGTYEISGTILIGSGTTLEFGEGVKLVRKSQAHDCLYNLFSNKHARNRSYDHDISIKGLDLDLNNLTGPSNMEQIPGLKSAMGFFYVKNLSIEHLTLHNLHSDESGLQVCAFEQLRINDASISGTGNAIRLGRGKHFSILNSTFATNKDPIALCGHDYMLNGPEMGWIEHGVIKNCTDLDEGAGAGFFARLQAGAWCEWYQGMKVHYGDIVVHQNHLYRLSNGGEEFTSTVAPTHTTGTQSYADGCNWLMLQDQEVKLDGGVKNVTFSDITLEKSRDVAFGIHFDNSADSRSFYPGAQISKMSGLVFDHIVQAGHHNLLMEVGAPVDTLHIRNSDITSGGIWAHSINTEGCVYDMLVVALMNCNVPNKFLSPDGYPAKLITVQAQESDWSNLAGKKLITIGDSQTYLIGWQPWLVDWLGINWSQRETRDGVDGHAAMSEGGTWMKPNDTQSICLRGRDAIYYHPEAIILYAGQNDVLSSWTSQKPASYKTPLEIVTSESPYYGDSVNTSISTISAFRGLIEYLQEKLPDTRLYLMTHVPILGVVGMNPVGDYASMYPSPRFATLQDVIDFEMSERYPKDDYIRAMGELYDLPVIDCWQYSGINFYNVSEYYDNPKDDCTQVHLNAYGDKLLARCIANYLISAPYRFDGEWVPVDSIGNNIIEEICEDHIYNLFGHRKEPTTIKDLPRGLYIIGRKKIFKQ